MEGVVGTAATVRTEPGPSAKIPRWISP
jgi:hypothetical protein